MFENVLDAAAPILRAYDEVLAEGEAEDSTTTARANSARNNFLLTFDTFRETLSRAVEEVRQRRDTLQGMRKACDRAVFFVCRLRQTSFGVCCHLVDLQSFSPDVVTFVPRRVGCVVYYSLQVPSLTLDTGTTCCAGNSRSISSATQLILPLQCRRRQHLRRRFATACSTMHVRAMSWLLWLLLVVV